MITDRRFCRGQLIPIADTDLICQKKYFPLQRQICGNVGRKSLITGTDSSSFSLQTQTSGSECINYVIQSTTTVHQKIAVIIILWDCAAGNSTMQCRKRRWTRGRSHFSSNDTGNKPTRVIQVSTRSRMLRGRRPGQDPQQGALRFSCSCVFGSTCGMRKFMAARIFFEQALKAHA